MLGQGKAMKLIISKYSLLASDNDIDKGLFKFN